MQLKGTTAIITGATGSLGSEIARGLAGAGCNCICHYNKCQGKAQTLVSEIEKTGGKAVAVQADLTEPGQIKKLFEDIPGWPTARIIINSAAIFSRTPLAEITFEKAREFFDLNVTAAILASKIFAEKINAQSKPLTAKIINIADAGAISPWAEYALYCSSKAALIGATKSLAKELAPSICVNAVAPGLITWPEDFDQPQKDRQLKRIPLGRIGKPKEIVDAIVFLLENDYITGQVLSVDGGRCI